MKEKGQYFEVFRLLIEAIMALMILVIIISVIGHFEKEKVELSKKRLFEGFSSAVESPNGDVIERSDLVFEKGYTVTAGALGRSYRMPEECIDFRAKNSAAISLQNQKTIVFNESITTSVFSRCVKQFESNCEIYCEVSFSEPFTMN